MVVGVPSDVGIMDAESVKDAVINAGAREVYIVYEPIAAALGLSLPIEKETPSVLHWMNNLKKMFMVIQLLITYQAKDISSS